MVFAYINEHKGMLSGVSWYRSNYDLAPPFDYWVIDNAWVLEPTIGGKQLGELSQMKLEKARKILPVTQQQFDLMVYAYEREHDFAADA